MFNKTRDRLAPDKLASLTSFPRFSFQDIHELKVGLKMSEQDEDAWTETLEREALKLNVLTAIAGVNSITIGQLAANDPTQPLDDLIGPIRSLIESGKVEVVFNASTLLRARK